MDNTHQVRASYELGIIVEEKIRGCRPNFQRQRSDEKLQNGANRELLVRGLIRSARVKNQTSESQAWGGLVGVIWMTAYWATLMPVWVYVILYATNA